MTQTTPSPTGSAQGAAHLPEHVDVLVVGAGLSGIGAAVRILEHNPGIELALLEGREATGGTWDLFRYPGVRSDSDMYTLSFPFRPWTGEQAIADGASILDYLRETSRQYGIDRRTHHGCQVVAASWSTPEQRWTVEIETTGDDGPVRRQVTTSYLHLGSGYYDYDAPHDAGFAGRDDFRGDIVHPQFWPEDLQTDGKRVVVIGSGATAVSLVPALAETAEQVTMLQRTPSYVFAVPERDAMVQGLRRVLPAKVVHTIARAKNLIMQGFLYQLSRVRPAAAKQIVMGDLRRRLPQETIDEHFTPPYDVWDQRLCAVRSGDLFEVIRSGAVEMATGHIDRFVPEGVRLTDGRVIEADVVVTATGLRLKALGGIDFDVDGEHTPLATTFAYRGLMVGGVPNVSMTVGYVNASWTLRADLVSTYVARLVRHMRDNGYGVAMPVAPEGMTAKPILDLCAGYVQRAIGAFPKAGDRAPWTMPQSYVRDVRIFRAADVTEDMFFLPEGADGVRLPATAHAPAELALPGSSSNVDGSAGDLAEQVPA